jgi:hypothetical protein
VNITKEENFELRHQRDSARGECSRLLEEKSDEIAVEVVRETKSPGKIVYSPPKTPREEYHKRTSSSSVVLADYVLEHEPSPYEGKYKKIKEKLSLRDKQIRNMEMLLAEKDKTIVTLTQLNSKCYDDYTKFAATHNAFSQNFERVMTEKNRVQQKMDAIHTFLRAMTSESISLKEIKADPILLPNVLIDFIIGIRTSLSIRDVTIQEDPNYVFDLIEEDHSRLATSLGQPSQDRHSEIQEIKNMTQSIYHLLSKEGGKKSSKDEQKSPCPSLLKRSPMQLQKSPFNFTSTLPSDQNDNGTFCRTKRSFERVHKARSAELKFLVVDDQISEESMMRSVVQLSRVFFPWFSILYVIYK